MICHPDRHYSKQKLIEVIPGKKVVWFVTDSKLNWIKKDKHEWTNTNIGFEITAKRDKTVLHLTHEGLVPEKSVMQNVSRAGIWLSRNGFSTLLLRKKRYKLFNQIKMTNKNYKLANYTVEIEVAKSPNDVFNHVIDLSKWWPEEFEGESIKLSTEFVFRIGDAHYSKNKVVEFVPNKKVVWLTTGSIRKTDNYDWTGTKFIFELTPKGDNTLLKFTYDGVILENGYDGLVQICDMTIKELFYNFIINGKLK